MRLKELLSEDYNQDLLMDLNNLLVAARAAGAKEIKTTDLVNQMQSMGYSVGTNSLLDLLSDNSVVANMTPDIIQFVNVGQSSNNNRAVDSAEKVKSLAAKASNLG
jgi:hypothetical protein